MKLVVNNLKLPVEHKENDISKAVLKYLHIDKSRLLGLKILHKSIDARKGTVGYVYSVEVDVLSGEKLLNSKNYKNLSIASKKQYQLAKREYAGKPIIIGAGPAGLFCAYACIEAGVSPIIIERGSPVDIRKKDVDDFWETGLLKPNSNVQFGEGGAGTFSDGKLNTLVKDKNGRCSYVMETFVKFGAPDNILYDAKPHVGTDILIDVVRNMREYIKENGGEFLFDTQVVDIHLSNGKVSGVSAITADGGSIELASDRIVVAIGHSARDTFAMINAKGIAMEAKSFAVGFRIEHPRQFIDITQYGLEYYEKLPAATYKLTAETSSGRGVYSFCMCPGGYVVNASSEEKRLAVNGMSYSGRNGNNSNTALIITVTPDDFPKVGNEELPLAGIKFQRELEEKAYYLGNSKIPVQRFGEFKKRLGVSDNIVRSFSELDYLYESYSPENKGGHSEADLTSLFPEELNRSFVEAMTQFGNKIKGFDNPKAYLSGVESRTSSPVRIIRDESGCSTNIKGLYPCGEGAGYAGGITSAAMDGLYIAERIISSNE